MTPKERAEKTLAKLAEDERCGATTALSELACWSDAIRQAVAEEREACAKIADSYAPRVEDGWPAESIAAEIRRRGQ